MTIILNDNKRFASIKNSIQDAYQGRTILITGGRGYIGSALTQSLSDINCKLLLLDQSPENAWMPEHKNAKVLVFNGDVSEKETWNSVLSGVDYVFFIVSMGRYFYCEILIFNILVLFKRPDKGLLKFIFLHYC